MVFHKSYERNSCGCSMLVQRWYVDSHISTDYQHEPSVSLLSGPELRLDISTTSAGIGPTYMYVDRIIADANKSPGLIKQNVKSKSQLEYAAAVWDSHTKDKKWSKDVQPCGPYAFTTDYHFTAVSVESADM